MALPKIVNPRDILFIAVIVVIVHILATPIYNKLDGGGSDASN